MKCQHYDFQATGSRKHIKHSNYTINFERSLQAVITSNSYRTYSCS